MDSFCIPDATYIVLGATGVPTGGLAYEALTAVNNELTCSNWYSPSLLGLSTTTAGGVLPYARVPHLLLVLAQLCAWGSDDARSSTPPSLRPVRLVLSPEVSPSSSVVGREARKKCLKVHKILYNSCLWELPQQNLCNRRR